jgi:hypothetical protein
VALGHFGTQFGKLVYVNFGGEDFAGSTDYLRRGKGVLSVARTDVGNDASGPPFHYGGQAFDFSVGVAIDGPKRKRSREHGAKQCDRQRTPSIHLRAPLKDV